MSSPALRVAASELGADFGPDLVSALGSLTVEQMANLCEAVLDADLRPAYTPPQHELWPLVNARTSTFEAGGSNRFHARSAGPAGLNLVAATDAHFAGTGRFPNGILRALLYCHGLVIEDPLALAAEMFLDASADRRRVMATSVVAGASSLVEIESLLRNGVVDTFFTRSDALVDVEPFRGPLVAAIDDPAAELDRDRIWGAFEATFVDGLQPQLQEIWRRVRAGDASPPLSLVEEAVAVSQDPSLIEVFIDVVASITPSAVVNNVIDVVAHTAADVARYGSRHDLLCPSPLYAELVYLGTARPADQLRLAELARVQVPRLDELLTEDAVAIRQNSEAFAAFRGALSRGLERAQSLRTEDSTPDDARAIVAETVAEARYLLFNELDTSPTMATAWRGLLGFVAGAVAGFAGTATGTPAAMAIGTAGGLAPPLVEAVARRAGNRDFLKRHYLLFETVDRS